MQISEIPKRLPPWFKIKHTESERFAEVRRLVRTNNLHTVCSSAACPNQNECWNAGTATFMILGNICTRGCTFCNVPKGRPEGLDLEEPARVADAVVSLKLRYAVVTSVTRDDLADGGSGIFAETIRFIRSKAPECRIEVLVPDFHGSREALRTVLNAGPDVLNHNVETVPSLYSRVRPQADYRRSLQLLKTAKAHNNILTKTGIMVGLGESIAELLTVFSELGDAGCDILTIGQYLRPGKDHVLVEKYYHPDEFDDLRAYALSMGFSHVVAGPLVRSSYHAGEYDGGGGRQSTP